MYCVTTNRFYYSTRGLPFNLLVERVRLLVIAFLNTNIAFKIENFSTEFFRAEFLPATGPNKASKPMQNPLLSLCAPFS